MRPTTHVVAIALFATVVLAAVGGAVLTDSAATTGASPGSGGAVTGEIAVSAAASLTDAFEQLATAFEADHADAEVVLNIGGSATLAAQVREGVPADVLAVANDTVLAPLVDEGLAASPPVLFATNGLRIVVPAGNPAGVRELVDLAAPGLFVGLCAPGQPCGDYAAAALGEAGLDPDAVADSAEPDVRALLGKVVAGELDAGIVYASDVLTAGDGVEGVPIPGRAEYPVVVLADAPNPGGAAAFVESLLSPAGQRILRAHGLDTPGP